MTTPTVPPTEPTYGNAYGERSGCAEDQWPAGIQPAECVSEDPCVPDNGVDGPGYTMWSVLPCSVEPVALVGQPAALPVTGTAETGMLAVAAVCLVGFGAMLRRVARR